MNKESAKTLVEIHRYFEYYYGECLQKLILYASPARGDAKPDYNIEILGFFKTYLYLTYN